MTGRSLTYFGHSFSYSFLDKEHLLGDPYLFGKEYFHTGKYFLNVTCLLARIGLAGQLARLLSYVVLYDIALLLIKGVWEGLGRLRRWSGTKRGTCRAE